MAESPVPDEAEVAAVARRLRFHGARFGPAMILFNAAVQRQPAQGRDPAKTPIGGLGVEPAEHLNPTNDNHSDTPEQPSAPVGGGL
jgi:hypothetical protein